MAILRNKNRNSYTVIDNAIFRDSTLSNKALGMLCRMLSLPDGWEFSILGLVKLSNDGKAAVMSQLTELEEHGYLMRRQLRVKGKLAGVEYIVSETKQFDFPYAENQHAEKPHAETQPQSNNKESINKLSNNKEIHTEFENLWGMYPRKQGKDKAFGYYERARKGGCSYKEVEDGIRAYIQYIEDNEVEMRYVKQGSTFFSQKAWQDDWSIRKRPTSGNPFLDLWEEGDF